MIDIQKARLAKGWSMYRLEKESGISHQQIARIERGQNCGIATYERLVAALS